MSAKKNTVTAAILTVAMVTAAMVATTKKAMMAKMGATVTRMEDTGPVEQAYIILEMTNCLTEDLQIANRKTENPPTCSTHTYRTKFID